MTKMLLTNWVEEKKTQAQEAYKKELLPGRVSHQWKYSDPNDFIPNPEKFSNISKVETPRWGVSGYSQKGVIVLDIISAIKQHEDLFRSCFGKLISKSPSKITLLNEAYWNSGFFIYIPKKMHIGDVITMSNGLTKSNSFYPTRNFVYLEEGAEAKLSGLMYSPDASNSYSNVVTEVFLEKGAKLTHAIIQNYSDSIRYHHAQRALLSEGSELSNIIISIGGEKSKLDFGVNLNEKGASASIYGIVLGNKKQTFDHHTSIKHNAPMTNSYLDFKVALKDKAKSAFTGNLFIDHSAVKSSAYQENRNLLLSEDAKAESIPELEILTNDVKRCSHGVTVGKIDMSQIFYLMSRGLSFEEAEILIVKGFLEPTISKIPESSPSIKRDIEMRIKQKLGDTSESEYEH